MNYLTKENIPEGKLPIYLCNVIVTIEHKNKSKKTIFTEEINKVVLKGITEEDLKQDFLKKKTKNFFTKTKAKSSTITDVSIELISNHSFGIVE